MAELDIPALRQAIAIVRRETRNLHVMTVVIGLERALDMIAIVRAAPQHSAPLNIVEGVEGVNNVESAAPLNKRAEKPAAGNASAADRREYQREYYRRRQAAKAAKG